VQVRVTPAAHKPPALAGCAQGLARKPLGKHPGYDKERLLLHRAAITTKIGDYDKVRRL